MVYFFVRTLPIPPGFISIVKCPWISAHLKGWGDFFYACEFQVFGGNTFSLGFWVELLFKHTSHT